MGSWFTNIHVRKNASVTEEGIAEYICKVMASLGVEQISEGENGTYSFAIITHEMSDWFTIYSDAFDTERQKVLGAFAMPMSEALCTDVLGITCYDSDFLLMNLTNKAEWIDAYAYVGLFDEEELLPRMDLSLWERKVRNYPHFVDSMQGEYVFAEEILTEIAPCLNLPDRFSNCGFDYMDELPGDDKVSYLYFA